MAKTRRYKKSGPHGDFGYGRVHAGGFDTASTTTIDKARIPSRFPKRLHKFTATRCRQGNGTPFQTTQHQAAQGVPRRAVRQRRHLRLVAHHAPQRKMGTMADHIPERQRVFWGADGRAEHPEVQAGITRGHIEVHAQGNYRTRFRADAFQSFHMPGAVYHKRDRGTPFQGLTKIWRVRFAPGGIGDQDILKPLFREEQGFPHTVGHNAQKLT